MALYSVKNGKATLIADVSKQPDWNQVNQESTDYIKNKPQIISLQDVTNIINEHEFGSSDHLTKIPIDHPDNSITTNKIANLNVTAAKLANSLDLQGKIIYVDTPIL